MCFHCIHKLPSMAKRKSKWLVRYILNFQHLHFGYHMHKIHLPLLGNIEMWTHTHRISAPLLALKRNPCLVVKCVCECESHFGRVSSSQLHSKLLCGTIFSRFAHQFYTMTGLKYSRKYQLRQSGTLAVMEPCSAHTYGRSSMACAL